jgi:hypothetical protein
MANEAGMLPAILFFGAAFVMNFVSLDYTKFGTIDAEADTSDSRVLGKDSDIACFVASSQRESRTSRKRRRPSHGKLLPAMRVSSPEPVGGLDLRPLGRIDNGSPRSPRHGGNSPLRRVSRPRRFQSDRHGKSQGIFLGPSLGLTKIEETIDRMFTKRQVLFPHCMFPARPHSS